MPWTDNNAIDGFDAILYAQAAGVTAAPGTADEAGWVTGFSYEAATETAQKGPYINSATIKNTIASVGYSGSFDQDVGTGTDTVLDALWSAVTNKTRMKLTFHINATTGEKLVFDQCIIGISGKSNPAEGHTRSVTFTADSFTRTAASA